METDIETLVEDSDFVFKLIGSLRNVGKDEFDIYESIYKLEKLLNRKIQRYDGLLKIELLHARNCCNLYLQGINNSLCHYYNLMND